MAVLDSAVAWWHADRYDPDSDTNWPDQSGNGHHAQLGSTSGADSNDPTFLPYDGTQGLYVPDESGHKVYSTSVPNARCLNGAEIIVDLARLWSTVGGTDYIFMVGGATGVPSISLYHDGATDKLGFFNFVSGNNIVESSTTLPAWNDWDRKQLRVTWDDVSGDVNFYYKDPADGGWTQLGTTVTGTSGTASSSGDDFDLGRKTNGTSNNGHLLLYDLKLYDNDSGGTLQLHLDCTDSALLTPGDSSITDQSSNGYSITIYRGTAVEPVVVNRNLWFYTGDDFHEVADHADLDTESNSASLTWYAVFRTVTSISALSAVMTKRPGQSSSDPGWDAAIATNENLYARISDGSQTGGNFSAYAISPGEFGGGGRRDAGTDIGAWVDGTEESSPNADGRGDCSNATALRMGAYGDATGYLKGAIVAAAVFDSALSDADMATLDTELKASYTSNAYSITGDVTLTLTPASTMAHASHYGVLGDITLSLTPNALMAHASHYGIVGDVTLDLIPAATMLYTTSGYSIIGDVTLSLTPASTMYYTPSYCPIIVNWGTGEITVPRCFMSPLGDNRYLLDLDELRLALKDLEDDEDGMPFPDTHRHNTEVTISGVTYARTVEFLSPYTVTITPAEPYQVVCTGANHNIQDVYNNLAGPTLLPGNSAGLIVTDASGLNIQEAADLEMVRKTMTNKQITDPATGKHTIYDDDDASVFVEADLYEDAAGTVPYQGQGAEHRERLK